MLKQKIKSSPFLSAKTSLAPRAESLASINLGFTMQKQLQTQWCWSAVATSTSLFYDLGSEWTQCKLVNQEFGKTSCCENGSSSACNQPWRLDLALERTRNLERKDSKAATFAQTQQEINSTRPLGARIGWLGGGGHFVILDGYDSSNGQTLLIKDPWYGSSIYSYSAFKTSYQGRGTWTHSYYTKPRS